MEEKYDCRLQGQQKKEIDNFQKLKFNNVL